jgi:alpha-mannosidase
MFKDVNTCYDAWELGSMYEKLPVSLDGKAEISVEEHPWSAVLTVKKQLHDSVLEQSIILNPDESQLIFVNTIHWQEKHKLLKVAFPVNAYANEAYHETQFGYVKRPVHRSYRTDRDRYEVCNHRYTALTDGAHGAAVLNDGKYGVNVVDNEIRLTLLRAPMMPDMKADQGNHRFTYSFYPFGQSFAQSDIVCQAAELNEQPIIGSVQKQIENRPVFVPMQKNIVVETIKPADTVENALLVRAYESVGIRTLASFQVAENIKKVEETDMLEEDPQGIVTDNVAFGPFEIKTFLLYL